MAGRVATAAISFQRKVEFVLPLPVWNTFTHVRISLACMNRMAGPAGAAAILPVDVHIMQIKLSVSELSQAHSIF
jgi:hypothetical protein